MIAVLKSPESLRGTGYGRVFCIPGARLVAMTISVGDRAFGLERKFDGFSFVS
jgi:hypothetical protein